MLHLLLTLLILLPSAHNKHNYLNYDILNYGHNINLALDTYFNQSANVQIDYNQSSTNIHALNMTINQDPILNVSSILLFGLLKNGSKVYFNQSEVLISRSIYNQPNTIFLMNNNMIFSIRYQYSLTDSISYVQVITIQEKSPCSQLELIQYNSQYFLIVGCLKNQMRVVLIAYKFQMSQTGVVLNLAEILPHSQLVISSQDNKCNRIQMYPYRQFLIKSILRYNGIIVFCAQTIRKTISQKIYYLSMNRRKSEYILVSQDQVVNDFQTIRFATCIRGSTFTTEYQNGFLSLDNNTLMYYSYAGQKSQCINYMQVIEHRFIATIRQSQTQYIYVIFSNRIIIKQSYSPNFQILYIKEPFIFSNNMTLQSYAITRKFLSLLYENNERYAVLIYDLSTVYPKRVNLRQYPKPKKMTITLFSVSNFLQNSNYFFICYKEGNQFNLYYYKGYELRITVNNPEEVLPEAIIHLNYPDDNNTDQSLTINITLRDFNDSTIVKTQNNDIAPNFKQFLNLNLSNYIMGPLGKFYTYPNNISAFQYVNYYTEINISDSLKDMKGVIGLSVNNVISEPLINLYFGYLTKTCQAYFNMTSKLMSIRDCKTLKKGKPALQGSQIIVLSQGKYIQYNKHAIEYCSLSTSNQYQCINLTAVPISSYLHIKLISYYYTLGEKQIIEIIVFNKRQLAFCCFQRNSFNAKTFNFILHYYVDANNIVELSSMDIKDVYFDEGYHNFLVLHLKYESDNNHKVIVYDKIDIEKDSSNSFIGHVIQSFSLYDLEAVFCIKNRLVLISMESNAWTIKQYKISKEYIIRYLRQYPLYNYIIKKGGQHTQNENYIYLQVYENRMQGNRYFIVYSPLKSSFGIMSHKFQRKGQGKLLFAQQIGEDNNNSMGINGDYLFGLTEPSLIFKVTPDAQNRMTSLALTRFKFNVSVVDNNNQMNILQYNFIYNQGQENIYYKINDTTIKIHFTLQTKDDNILYHISPVNIQGPVDQYTILLDDKDSDCLNFDIIKRDVFTKKECLLYSNSYQYGIMSDFISFRIRDYEIEIIVTDVYLFCLNERSLSNSVLYDLGSLKNCEFEQDEQTILMICDNTTSMAKEIFLLKVAVNQQYCQVGIKEVKIPQWFTYIDFAIAFNEEFIIFQVPIRFEQNKIYYKANFSKGDISDAYSILNIQRENEQLYLQFQTLDTSISSNLFLILQNGIGIYNLSDSIKSINPALWISKEEIQTILNISPEDNLVYLKHLFTQSQDNMLRIVIQLGAQSSTYDIEIIVALADASLQGQTRYVLLQKNVLYEYQQYANCKNTRQSESRRYNQMIIKICSYQPPDLFVFANFISITNQTSNYLIQFYRPSGTQSFPFRIDNIYSNLNSYDSFSIRENTLIVGSLFNFLCYYNLATNLQWEFRYKNPNRKITVTNIYNDIPDEVCPGQLLISNNQMILPIAVQLAYIYDERDDVWSDYKDYIQRVSLLLILLNTMRLVYKQRKEKQSQANMRLKKKSSSRLHTSRFEVMVKINSKFRI